MEIWQSLKDQQMLKDTIVKSLGVKGDIAECGVAQGGTANLILNIMGNNSKTLHLFDTFTGQPDLFTEIEKQNQVDSSYQIGRFNYPITEVKKGLNGLDNYEFHAGLFSEILPEFHKPLCFIHADGDQYKSTLDIIRFIDMNLVIGGYVIFHDYKNPDWMGVAWALDELFNYDDYEYTEGSVDNWQLIAKRIH